MTGSEEKVPAQKTGLRAVIEKTKRGFFALWVVMAALACGATYATKGMMQEWSAAEMHYLDMQVMAKERSRAQAAFHFEVLTLSRALDEFVSVMGCAPGHLDDLVRQPTAARLKSMSCTTTPEQWRTFLPDEWAEPVLKKYRLARRWDGITVLEWGIAGDNKNPLRQCSLLDARKRELACESSF